MSARRSGIVEGRGEAINARASAGAERVRAQDLSGRRLRGVDAINARARLLVACGREDAARIIEAVAELAR